MRRRDDRVILRTLRLLIAAQIAEALAPLASVALWGINPGYIVAISVPVAIALYLGLELRKNRGGK